MKLLSSLLVGCGLVGAGLAVPAPIPQRIVADEGESLTRAELGQLDASSVDVARPTSLAEQLSQFVSAALDRLPFFDVTVSVTPVFTVDADDAQMMTDVDGDLVLVSSGQRVRAIIWNPSSRTFYQDSMSSPRARLPAAILIVSLWLLFACLYLGRSAENGPVDSELGPASASAGRRFLCPRDLRTRERLAEKLASDTKNGAPGSL